MGKQWTGLFTAILKILLLPKLSQVYVKTNYECGQNDYAIQILLLNVKIV